MKHSGTFIILFIALVYSSNITGQNKDILMKFFRLENSISQHGNTFRFWRGSEDSSKSRIVIERIENKAETIVFNDLVNDGVYKIYDANHDGFKDFILYYHDYDVIYFFNKEINNFNDNPVYLPGISGIVNPGRNVYWGYRDAQYSEKYAYSILYKYNGCDPYFLFKIVYKTPAEYEGRTHALKIDLYKFDLGDYQKPIFVKEIKLANPSVYNYKKYWNENYKRLTR